MAFDQFTTTWRTSTRRARSLDGRPVCHPSNLTASNDNTARLWDRDGKPLATLQGHTGWVYTAVFAPDGGRILTASDDNTARLWEAFPEPKL